MPHTHMRYIHSTCRLVIQNPQSGKQAPAADIERLAVAVFESLAAWHLLQVLKNHFSELFHGAPMRLLFSAAMLTLLSLVRRLWQGVRWSVGWSVVFWLPALVCGLRFVPIGLPCFSNEFDCSALPTLQWLPPIFPHGFQCFPPWLPLLLPPVFHICQCYFPFVCNVPLPMFFKTAAEAPLSHAQWPATALLLGQVKLAMAETWPKLSKDRAQVSSSSALKLRILR